MDFNFNLDFSPLSSSEKILSNNYADFISPSSSNLFVTARSQQNALITPIWSTNYALFLNRDENPPLTLENYPYRTIPKCFSPMDEASLEQSGILTMQNYPGLELKGQGILIGFIDTGIDYTNPIFVTPSGESRIVSIWDQTIESGTPPQNFLYGTEYANEQLNLALSSDNPYSIVPSRDLDGHGTFLASVAAGNPVPEESFTGVAPEAEIVVVKVKTAKPYLKEYYRIPEDIPAYQENDLLFGIKYLLQISETIGKPLVICFGMGSNQGDHTGSSNLADYLNVAASNIGVGVVTCTGNEADAQHHYRGFVNNQDAFEDVEIRVGENSYGFTAELWSSYPNQYTISLISPSGEIIPRIPARLRQSQLFTFILDTTQIAVDYELSEVRSGSELIQLRFINPTAGIWRLRIYGSDTNLGPFDIWLSLRNFINDSAFFLKPDPYITLTEPSAANLPITVGAYQTSDISLFLESGRGFSRDGNIKPDFLAPGVGIQGTVFPGQFENRSGTSISAAITAGVLAQLFTWAFTLGNDPNISTTVLKYYLIRGADRKIFLTYPNEDWGYGTLNLFQTFERLRTQ